MHPQKDKSLKLARQASGMLTKVITLMEEGKYCPDIIQQIDASMGFLKSAKRELLAGHLDTCLMKKMTEDKDKTIKELLKIYNLSN